MGQKFCRNRCILLRFRAKHVFLFNAEIQVTEIQEGCQKWQEDEFCEMLPIARYPACQKISSKSLFFRHKRVFAFNTETQDGLQKWQENNFSENRQ